MGLCVSKAPTTLLEEERPSPDFFEHRLGPVHSHQVQKSGATGAGDRKGKGDIYQQHAPRAQYRGQQQSSSSSISDTDGMLDDNNNSPGRGPCGRTAFSSIPGTTQHVPSAPIAATSPFETEPSIAATAAARSNTSATTTAPDSSPNAVAMVKADTLQSSQHQGTHSRPPTATRKKSSTSRRSAESKAIGHDHQQHQPGSKASHKAVKREHREGHRSHETKDRHSPDQQQSGKLKLQTSQVLKVPSVEAADQQADTDAHDDGHKVEDRTTSFLPPLVDVKQQRSQPQSPAEPPKVMHAVPAARGGPTEPGLWVLRRTGCVHDKYVMTQTMGRGQFGIVCIAVEKATGEKWACKSVSKRRVQGMHDFSMVDVLREVELLYLVGGHPGVVGLREVYEDEEDLHLVMELCQGGDWFEHLLNDGRYTETEAAQVVHGVLEALAYCHSLGVMHRDIKPENIMFTDRTRGATVKLTDFGLSTMFSSEPLSEVLGSAYYVAPEVLRECYSKEADVWSLGVVLFIALGGYAPFDGKNEREVFTKILHEPLQFSDPSWDDISLAARDMISRMLTKDPRARASVHELLDHPWFAQVLPPRSSSLTVLPRSPSLTAMGQPLRPLQHLPKGERFRVEVSAASEPSAMGRSVSAAVRNKGVGWADDVVGGDLESEEAHKSKRALHPTHSQARHARSIAAALEAASARGAALQTVPDAVIARLQQFAAMNAFKREARRVVATYLPEEEVVGLLTLFRHMDTDKDGVVSMEELCQALEQRGVHVPDEHAKLLFKRSHHLGQEGVDYVEFLAATLHLGRLERDERLWRAFRHFDVDNTGFISRANLVSALPHLGKKVDKAVDRILAEVDKDGDGRVCYAEFCDMLRHQPDPPELSHDPHVAAAAHAAPAGHWGAWAERTESGRLQLAVPPESRYPTRATSFASSRNVSSNDRHSRSKSHVSSGTNSYRTRNSSNGEAISASPAGPPAPHLISNVLSNLHSTRAHSQQTTPETNNSSRTRASSNKSNRTHTSCNSHATSMHAHSWYHAGSSRFGSMREAAALATGHAHYHTDRPVERAAAAAVAQYPEPSVSTEDGNDDVEADCEARLSWAKSVRANRQASDTSGDATTSPDPAFGMLLQQRREQLQQEEGMPRPAMRNEHSARSRNNSRVQWALPDSDEEEEERREAERELGKKGGNVLGAGGNCEGPAGESFVGSVDSTVGVSSRENSVSSAKKGKGKGQAKSHQSAEGEQSLGEWAKNGIAAAHGMAGQGGPSSLVRDASGGHGQQAAAARKSAASSVDQDTDSVSFRLIKTNAFIPPGVVNSHDGSNPPTPFAQQSTLAPVRTNVSSPIKAGRNDGGAASSPSTHCSSPLFEGPCKNSQLAARAPHRLGHGSDADSCPAFSSEGSTAAPFVSPPKNNMAAQQEKQGQQRPRSRCSRGATSR